ncbi:hypothetical protein Efla_000238 [Eimeria flavescens]
MAGRQREPLVYWEKQGPGRMCALHCLNSVLQGPYFTEAELSAIGMELDQKERQLMAEGGTHSEDYRAFLAEGSGNVAADGYFNVSVLIECLRRRRIHCICQRNVGDHEESGIDFGYILNHADHWLALRRVHGTWYNLDSVKPAPVVISSFHLAAFLSSLKGQGYTTFVVRPEVGDLPAPGCMQTRSNSQFYLTQKEIDELHRKAAAKEREDADNAQRVAGQSDGSSARTFLTSLPRGKEPHVWPEGEGYRLSGSPSPGAAPPDDGDDDTSDPELKEAIRLSMECYKKAVQPRAFSRDFLHVHACKWSTDLTTARVIQEVPQPPEEPPASEERVKIVFVRTPSGKRLSRRFSENNTVKRLPLTTAFPLQQVCDWIIFESQSLEGIRPLSVLSSFSLFQTFPRSEGVEVTLHTLDALDFQAQEQLMLQLQ